MHNILYYDLISNDVVCNSLCVNVQMHPLDTLTVCRNCIEINKRYVLSDILKAVQLSQRMIKYRFNELFSRSPSSRKSVLNMNYKTFFQIRSTKYCVLNKGFLNTYLCCIGTVPDYLRIRYEFLIITIYYELSCINSVICFNNFFKL